MDVTNIPAPRVEFIDKRTGLMAREWYLFFLNLFNLTGGGTNNTSLIDVQQGPPATTIDELGVQTLINQVDVGPAPLNYDDLVLRLQDQLCKSPLSQVDEIAQLTQKIQSLELAPPNTPHNDSVGTGWANYLDTTYTVSAPFTVLDGVTATLPNNAGTVIDRYLPDNVSMFYDAATQKFTPGAVGDYNLITIRFNAESTSTSTYLEFGIDIGGTMGVIFRDIKVFPKGAGVEHPFTFVCPGFSLDTFLANGGTVKVTPVGGDVDIYGINYHFARVHAA